MIDINILPLKARNELIDFYQFLVERYASGKSKKQATTISTSNQVDSFFDHYNIDLSDFSFNREDLYD
jgi:hypothetical protein